MLRLSGSGVASCRRVVVGHQERPLIVHDNEPGARAKFQAVGHGYEEQ